jgi:hypothetical protein
MSGRVFMFAAHGALYRAEARAARGRWICKVYRNSRYITETDGALSSPSMATLKVAFEAVRCSAREGIWEPSGMA